jgi:hypothetical protein
MNRFYILSGILILNLAITNLQTIEKKTVNKIVTLNEDIESMLLSKKHNVVSSNSESRGVKLNKEGVGKLEAEPRIDDITSELEYLHSKWSEYLQDALVHTFNLENYRIKEYEKLVNEYFVKTKKMHATIAGFDISVNSKSVMKNLEELVYVQKDFESRTKEILGTENIKLIDTVIRPEFNKIYRTR